MIIPCEIYFERVNSPEIGKMYFQFQDGVGFPVSVLSGQFYANNGRLSNSWEWRNLNTGEKQSGYGCFYEMKTRED